MNFGVGATTSVDVVIAVAAMFVAAPAVNVTATVRVLTSATCGAALVVIPDDTVTEHDSPALMVAVAAVRARLAVLVSDAAPAAVKVVEPPHPLETNTVGLESMPKVGMVTVTTSPTSSGAFNWNVKETDVSVATSAGAKSNLLSDIAVTATSVEASIVTAAMVVEPDTAAVRVLKSAACAAALVVIPVGTVVMDTVHCVRAASVCELACNVSVAVDVPEFEADAVNVVPPHPLAAGVASDARLNSGRTRATFDDVTSGTFRAKMNSKEVGAAITGFPSFSLV